VALVVGQPAMAAPLAPNAMPSGGVVVGGSAAISQGASTTTINQASQRAAINWQSFDVGAQARVQFNQPNAAAVALNRVVGANPSRIAGRIDANGQLVLVNQDGVQFYRGAQVNTAGLIVSASGISTANFMAGRMVFDQPAHPGARIDNAGTLTVREAGLAALVAPAVANAGVINAKLGHVVLAGARTATLDLYGDGLMALDVGSQVREVPAGPDGRPVAALVTNTGTILAPGGTVELTARAVDGIVQNLVSAGGTIAAASVGGQAGTVVLSGVGGAIEVSGALLAQGVDPGTQGGRIKVLPSGTATLTSTARLDASGAAGGGTIAVGTTLRRAAGGPAVTGARQSAGVTVASGATIAADATAQGNGGKVAVLSAGTTTMNGRISARGGQQGGDGGSAEVSGGVLALGGAVDLSAPLGRTGTLLLDPLDLYISDAPPSVATYTVVAGDLPTIGAGGASSGASLSWVTPALLEAAGANLALAATRNIFFASGTLGANTLAIGSHTLSVSARHDISLDRGFTINAGALTLAASGAIALGTSVGATVGLGALASPTPTVLTIAGTATMRAATGITLADSRVAASLLDLSVSGSGGVSETAGGVLAAATLQSSGGVAGTASLLGTANAIATIGPLAVTGGDLVALNGGLLALAGGLSGNTVFIASESLGAGPLASGLALHAATLAAGSRISLIADRITETGGNTLTAATLELAPYSAATAIALGAAGSAGTLGIDATLLGDLTAGSAGLLRLGTVTPTAGLTGAEAGPITLQAAVDLTAGSHAGTLELASTGAVTATGGHALTVATLASAGTIGGTVDLSAAGNDVGTLGAFAAGGSLTLANAGTNPLTVTGPVTAPGVTLSAAAITLPAGAVLGQAGATLDLIATGLSPGGTIAEDPAATLLGARLLGSATNTVTLRGSANAIATLGPFGVTGAGLGFTDSSALAVVGAVTAAGVSLTAAGITLAPGALLGLAGAPVTLASSGGIAEDPTARIAAGTLTGSAAGPVTLLGTANAFATIGPFAVTGGELMALDAGPLTLAGGLSATTLFIEAKASPGAAITLQAATLTATGGRIALVADTLTETGSNTLAAPTVELAPFSTGTAIALGAAGGAGTLGIDAALLGAIAAGSAGTLVIGTVTPAPGLTAATAAGITLGTLVDLTAGAHAGLLRLASTAGVAEAAGDVLAVATLASVGAIAGAVALAGTANAIGTLGPFAVNGAGLALVDGGALAIAGAVTAPAVSLRAAAITLTPGALLDPPGLVTLTSAGAIAEDPAATIDASTLTGSAGGAVTLLGTANAIATLGPFGVTGGGLALVDASALAVAGAVTAAGVSLHTGGGITLTPGALLGEPGQTVMLTSAGGIAESPAAAIAAAWLTGSAAGPVTLPGTANAFATLGPFAVTGGALVALDAGPLTLAGALSATTIFIESAASPASAITLDAAVLTAAGGRIALVADRLGATGSTALTAATVELAPASAGTAILLGGAGGAGTLGIDTALLGAVAAGSAGTLVVGTVTATGGLTGATAAGIALGPLVDLATGSHAGVLRLASTAGVTQAAADVLAVATLQSVGSIGGSAASLPGTANAIGTLGPFAAGVGLTLTDGGALTLAGAVTAPQVTLTATALALSAGTVLGQAGAVVDLIAGGPIAEDAAAQLLAGTLTGSAAGAVALLGTANAVGTLGAFGVTGAGLTLLDGSVLTASGPVAATTTVDLVAPTLTVTGAVAAGMVTLTASTGTLGLSGTVTAASATLAGRAGILGDTGTILGDGALTATSAGGAVSLLDAANMVATLSGSAMTDFRLADGAALMVNTVTAGGTAALAAPTLTVANAVSAPTVALTADTGTLGLLGTVTAAAATLAGQAGILGDTGTILGDGALTASSAGGAVSLRNVANRVATLGGSAMTDFRLADGAALVVNTVTAGGTAALAAPTLTVANAVSAPTVALTAGTGTLGLLGTVTAAAATLAGQAGIAGTVGTILGDGALTAASAGGAVDLRNAANAVATLSGSAHTDFRLADGAALVVNTVTAGGTASLAAPTLTVANAVAAPTVALTAGTGTLGLFGTVTAATAALAGQAGILGDTGTILGDGTLTASSAAGAVSLRNAANVVAALSGSAYSDFLLTDGAALVANTVTAGGTAALVAPTLTVATAVAAPVVALTATTGTLGLLGTVTAAAATLAGQAGIAGDAGTLLGDGALSASSAAGSVSLLDGANAVAVLTGSAAIDFRLADGAALVANTVTAGGTASLSAPTLTVDTLVAAPALVTLISGAGGITLAPGAVLGEAGTALALITQGGGPIAEPAGATILAGTLLGHATGAVSLLGTANAITTVNGFLGAAGIAIADAVPTLTVAGTAGLLAGVSATPGAALNLANTGTIRIDGPVGACEGTVAISAAGIVVESTTLGTGAVWGAGNVTLTAGGGAGTIAISGGSVETLGTLTLAAGLMNQTGGLVAAAGDVRVPAGTLAQAGGTLLAQGLLAAPAATLTGGTAAAGAITLGTLTLGAGAALASGGAVTLADLTQSGGSLAAIGTVTIGTGAGAPGTAGSAATSGTVAQTGGTLLALGDISLWTTGTLVNDGLIAAGGMLGATAGQGIRESGGTLSGAGGVRLLASAGNALQSGGAVLVFTGPQEAVIQAPGGTNDFSSFGGALQLNLAGRSVTTLTCPADCQPLQAVIAIANGPTIFGHDTAPPDVALVGARIAIGGNLTAGVLQLYSEFDTTEQPGVAITAASLTGSAGVPSAAWSLPPGLAALGWTQAGLGWTAASTGNAILGTIPALPTAAAVTVTNPNAIARLADYATTGTLALADGLALTVGGLTLPGTTTTLSGLVSAGGDATLAAAGTLALAAGAGLAAAGNAELVANTALAAASAPGAASGSILLGGPVAAGGTLALYAAETIAEPATGLIGATTLTGRAGLLATDPSLPANWRVDAPGAVSLAGTANAIATLGPFLATGDFTLADFAASAPGLLTVTGPVAAGFGRPGGGANLALTSAGTVRVQGAVAAANAAQVTTGSFVLSGGTVTAGSVAIAAPGGSTITSGAILTNGAGSGDGIAIAAGPVTLTAGTLSAAGTANADILLAQLTQAGGTIVAAGNIGLAALRQSGGAIGAGGNALVGSGTGAPGTAGSAAGSGGFDQTGGTLLAQGDIRLWTTGLLTNTGLVAAGGMVQATAATGIGQAGTLAGLGGVRLLASTGDATQVPGGLVAAGTLASTGVVIQAPLGTNDFTRFAVVSGVQAVTSAPGARSVQAAAASTARVDVTLVGSAIDIAGNLTAGTLQLYSWHDTTERPGVAIDALALAGSAGVPVAWAPPPGLAALGWTQALLGWTAPAAGNAVLGTIPALPTAAAVTLSNANTIGLLADYATTGTLALADAAALAVGGLTLAGNPVQPGTTTVLTGQVRAGLLGGDATLAAAGSLSLAAGAALAAPTGTVELVANSALTAATAPGVARGSLLLAGRVAAPTVALYAAQNITEPGPASIGALTLTGRAGLLAADTALPANWRVDTAGAVSLTGTANAIATLGTFLATGNFALADAALTVAGPVMAGYGMPGSGANLTLDIAGALLVQGAVGDGTGNTTLAASGDLTVATGGVVSAFNQAILQAGHAFVLNGGTVAAGSAVIAAPGGSTLDGGAIATTGQGSGDGINLATGPATLNAGTLSATGARADILLAGLTQTGGTLSANGNLAAEGVTQSGGTMAAAGTIWLASLRQGGGAIGAGGDVSIGRGTGAPGTAGSAASAGSFVQTGGTLLAQGNVTLWTTGLLTNDGLIAAGGQVAATAGGGIAQAGTLAGLSGVVLLASAGDAAQAASGLVQAGTGAAGAVIQAPAGTNSFSNFLLAENVAGAGAAVPFAGDCPACAVPLPSPLAAGPAVPVATGPTLQPTGTLVPQGHTAPDVTLLGASIDIARDLAAGTLQLYSWGNTTERPGVAITAATLTGSAGVPAGAASLPAGLAALGWTPALLGWTAPAAGNATLGTLTALPASGPIPVSNANAIGLLTDYAATGTLSLTDAAALTVGPATLAGNPVQPGTTTALAGRVQAGGDVTLAATGSLAVAAGAEIAAGGNVTLIAGGAGGGIALADGSRIGTPGTLALAAGGTVAEAAGARIGAGTLASLASGIGGDLALPSAANAIATIGSLTVGGSLALADPGPLAVQGPLAAANATIGVGALAAPETIGIAGKISIAAGGTLALAAGAGGIHLGDGAAIDPPALLALGSAGGITEAAGAGITAEVLSSLGPVGGAVSLAGTANAIGMVKDVTAQTTLALADNVALALAGTIAAPLIAIDTQNHPLTLANGATLLTGGIAQPANLPSGPAALPFLPSAATTGGGAYLTAGSFAQQGRSAVAPLAGGTAPTVLSIATPGGGGMRFDPAQGLVGPTTWLVLNLGTTTPGQASGNVFVKSLALEYAPPLGTAGLFGSVNELTGLSAAGAGVIVPTPNPAFRFNNCPIHSINCVLLPTQQIPTANPLQNFSLDTMLNRNDEDELLLPIVTDQDY
jgi:filamentous hemagglutinin family protein